MIIRDLRRVGTCSLGWVVVLHVLSILVCGISCVAIGDGVLVGGVCVVRGELRGTPVAG